MFDIRLERRGRSNDAVGEIVIGTDTESFIAELSFWDIDDYVASWLRASANVLERGYGRFLISVHAPGQATYHNWVCRVQGDEAMLFKSFLLPTATEDLAAPEQAETFEDDYPDRNKDEPNLVIRRCSLTDIAAFESRLRGQAMT